MTDETVVETEVQGNPEAEAESSPVDTLESALAEFDKAQTQEEEKASTPELGVDEIRQTVGEVQQFMQDQRQKTLNSDLNALAKEIVGDTGEDIGFARGYMEYRAQTAPDMTRAFLGRHSNPEAFAKVKAGLKNDFAKSRQSKVDDKATDDVAAVNSAVRAGSTTAQPDAKSSWDMNDQEWSQYKKDHGVIY